MGIIGFIVPSKSKLILFILILLFVPMLFYVANPDCPQALGTMCEPYWMFIPFILLGFSATGIGTQTDVAFSVFIFTEFWQSILINVVIAYLIACIIAGFIGRYRVEE